MAAERLHDCRLRLPPSVTGDGVLAIRQLIEAENLKCCVSLEFCLRKELGQLETYRNPVIKNHLGEAVGRIEPVFTLQQV